MRLLGMDAYGGWHVMSVSEAHYDADDRTLSITVVSGEEYTINDINRHNAEDIIRMLYNEGKAELSIHYRIV